METKTQNSGAGSKARSAAKAKTVLGASRPSARAKARFPVALIEEHFKIGERPVTFALFAPDAREVFVAGAFNGWDSKRTPLVRREGGRWEVQVTLGPGAYEYRLVVDGVWQEDPMSERFAANPFGGLNSVILIRD